MTWVVMALLLAGGAAFQGALPGIATLGHAKPPLLLCVVLYYAFRRRTVESVAALVLAGLLRDGLSWVPLGYSVLLFAAFSLVARRSREFVDPESPAVASMFGAGGGAAVSLALWSILRIGGAVQVGFLTAVTNALGTAALGAVCAPVLLPVVAWVERSVGSAARREERHGLG